jgi:diacylglycerol kinase (ATP)
MSPLLIVNPRSGARRDAPALAHVLAAVEASLGDVVVRYTARPGHARELAAEGAREGYPLIVAVGGDGTFSEVVNGVLTAQNAPGAGEPPNAAETPCAGPAVGLVDVGTGGDFRRSLGVGPGYRQCLDAIALGRERLVDVGRASFVGTDGIPTQQYFVNVLSAGLGGLVDRYVASAPAFLGGRGAYYLASLRAVVAGRERPILARVTWQGETREETIPAYLIAICNGRWFGGGMDIAPMALVDDGRLEVLTITERSRVYLAAKIRKVYPGDHLDEPTVHHFPCERIELRLVDETAERHFLLDVDGDYLGSLPLVVEVLPKRLRVRA